MLSCVGVPTRSPGGRERSSEEWGEGSAAVEKRRGREEGKRGAAEDGRVERLRGERRVQQWRRGEERRRRVGAVGEEKQSREERRGPLVRAAQLLDQWHAEEESFAFLNAHP
eukprot:2576134-Rhodomonas_salina.1